MSPLNINTRCMNVLLRVAAENIRTCAGLVRSTLTYCRQRMLWHVLNERHPATYLQVVHSYLVLLSDEDSNTTLNIATLYNARPSLNDNPCTTTCWSRSSSLVDVSKGRRASTSTTPIMGGGQWRRGAWHPPMLY